MVDIIQPLDFLGRMGGPANLPNLIGDASAITAQRDQQAATIDALRSRALFEQSQAAQQIEQQQRAQAYQQALRGHLESPTAGSAANLSLQFPEYSKQINDAYALQDGAKRDGELRLKSTIYSRAHAGDWGAAGTELERYIKAAKDAGEDVSDEEAMLAHLKSGDPARQKMAIGILGYDLATIVGPDKWADFHGNKVVGNALVGNTGDVKYEAPEKATKPQYMNVDGTVIELGAGGGSPANVVDAIIGVEGTAKNPNSSAVGVGQFVDGTWIEQFKARYPNTTLSVPEILKLKTNPKLARDLTAQYVEANTAKLGAAGVATDAPSVYLAHFLGPQDAIDVLRANPSTPVADIVAPESIAANKSVLAGKTAGEVRQWAAGKMGGTVGGPRVVYSAPASDASVIARGQVIETPSGPMIVDKATGEARPVTMGGKPVNAQTEQKRAAGAKRVLALLDTAEKLIPLSTGSGLGALRDFAGRGVGYATEGSKAIAKLQSLSGALIADMPRMEGPQSDKDVQLYKQAAGDLANPTIPNESRLEALATLREIQTRYAGAPAKPAAKGGWSIRQKGSQ